MTKNPTWHILLTLCLASAFASASFGMSGGQPGGETGEPVTEDGSIIILRADYIFSEGCRDEDRILYIVTSEKVLQDLIIRVDEAIEPPTVKLVGDDDLKIKIRAAAKRRVYGRTPTGLNVIFISIEDLWDL